MQPNIEEAEKRYKDAWREVQEAEASLRKAQARLSIEETRYMLATRELKWKPTGREDEWTLWALGVPDREISTVEWTGSGRRLNVRFHTFPSEDWPVGSGFINPERAKTWVMDQLQPYLPKMQEWKWQQFSDGSPRWHLLRDKEIVARVLITDPDADGFSKWSAVTSMSQPSWMPDQKFNHDELEKALEYAEKSVGRDTPAPGRPAIERWIPVLCKDTEVTE